MSMSGCPIGPFSSKGNKAQWEIQIIKKNYFCYFAYSIFCEGRPACETMTPLGLPVVPEVYTSRQGWFIAWFSSRSWNKNAV
jgi:hypothetical protein